MPLAGEHGGDGAAVAAWLGIDPADIIDLSMSLNPFAPDLASHLAGSLDALGRYPDPASATQTLADAIGVDAGRMLLTNGGAEAIALVAHIEPVGHIVAPEFGLYARHLRELSPTGGRWRSNPSNPLGQLAAATDGARVWDEAFWPMSTGSWTRGDDRSWRLGSLTKLWACPGLRLGYVIAPDVASAELARRLQPHWSVNGLALMAVQRLVPVTDLVGWANAIAARRQELVAVLRHEGFAVLDTEAAWVLVEHPGLREQLLPYGVVVRDCASFGMPGRYRIAVPTDAQFDRLGEALAARGQAAAARRA